MPGRRRVRILAAVLLFVVVAVVYTRKSQVEAYRDYVTEKVVGGGSVLRGKPEVQEPAALPTSQPAAIPTTTISTEVESTSIEIVDGTSSTIIRVASSTTSNEATSTSSIFFPELTWHPPKPTETVIPIHQPGSPHFYGDDDELGYEVGEGRVDNEDPIVSTTSKIHWIPHTEHFPVSTTIQLPSGSPKPMPRIQYTGKDAGKADVDRLAIIKESAEHAWNGYAEVAFGMDEVKPISGGHNNPFNGWGATLVDSLDTLWIMGMTEAFEEAVDFVKTIDFTTSLRSDIPLFETTIRYLGGLIAAYDISDAKYRILLDKAVELAEVFFAAFDTPNRMPQTFYRWKPAFASQPHRASNRVVMAELGSLSLEFTRLAQLTGEPKYYDAIARITDAFQEWQNNTRVPGMWPTTVDASGCEKPAQMGARPVRGGQQPVPGGDGQVMHAGEPVKHENVVHSTTPKVDVKQQMAAQAKLKAQRAAKEPGMGKIIGHGDPLTEGSLDGKSRESLLDEVASSKAKRQLDLDTMADMTDEERHEAIQRMYSMNTTKLEKELRRSPLAGETTTTDTRTGQEVCIPQGLASTSKNGQESFALGGQSDSTYEYLPKEYLLLGGLVEQYKEMYIASADSAIENIIFRPMTIDSRDVLISGSLKVSLNHSSTSDSDKYIKRFVPEGEHLTCFAGGMFALGGKIFNRPGDVEIGRKLTDGCVWAYNSTTTGIMPEVFTAIECEDWASCEWNQTEYWHLLDPYEETRTKLPKVVTTSATSGSMATATMTETKDDDFGVELSSVLQVVTGTASTTAKVTGTSAEEARGGIAQKRQLEQLAEPDDVPKAPRPGATPSASASVPAQVIEYDIDGQHQPAAVAALERPPIYTPKAPLSHDEFVKKKIEDERLPPGMVKVNARSYILRPEAIESVFYMYRITGDQYWRDMGWKMFTAIDEHTRALYGNSAIDDVTKMAPEPKDTMESFWLAETLKYFYLLFDDAERYSLDDWVLNTEAHFFKRPEGGFVDE